MTDVDTLYRTWQTDPSNKKNLRAVVDSMQTDIDRAISAHVGSSSPAIKTQARLLAAKAIKNYNPNSGTKLRSWVHIQMQPLKRYGRNLSPLPIPERMMRQMNELRRAEQEWMDNVGREPTDSELADVLGTSIKALNKIRESKRMVVSEGPLRGDASSDPTFGTDVVAVKGDKSKEIIDIVYYSLTPPEQLVMDYRLGMHGKTAISNNEIAKKLKISPSTASQIANSIAAKLEEIESYGR